MYIKKGKLLFFGVFVCLAFGMAIVSRLGYHSYEGYFSPVYSTNGKEVYYINRNTQGIVWGLGMEFFTPPAHAFVLSDNFSLRKIDLQTGKIETVKQWPPSLLTHQHIQEYRGRIFFIPQTQLRISNEAGLEYKLGLNGARIENFTTTMFWVARIWDGIEKRMIEKDSWHKSGDATSGYDEFPLSGDWEVMPLRGQECYPAAIVAFNHITSEVRIIIKNNVFDRLYQNGIKLDMLIEFSKRFMIERDEQIKKAHRELIKRFQVEGQSKVGAILKTNKEMERMGYYPKSTTLTARVLNQSEENFTQENGEEPIFAIEPDEMRSGIFQDIEQAISKPGEPVDKTLGQYIIHRDYNNSQRLNLFLDSGGTRFCIRYEERAYEIKINRP